MDPYDSTLAKGLSVRALETAWQNKQAINHVSESVQENVIPQNSYKCNLIVSKETLNVLIVVFCDRPRDGTFACDYLSLCL